jgi:hypothetical protein
MEDRLLMGLPKVPACVGNFVESAWVALRSRGFRNPPYFVSPSHLLMQQCMHTMWNVVEGGCGGEDVTVWVDSVSMKWVVKCPIGTERRQGSLVSM